MQQAVFQQGLQLQDIHFVFRFQGVILPKQGAGRKKLPKGASVNDASMKEKS